MRIPNATPNRSVARPVTPTRIVTAAALVTLCIAVAASLPGWLARFITDGDGAIDGNGDATSGTA